MITGIPICLEKFKIIDTQLIVTKNSTKKNKLNSKKILQQTFF